MSLYVKKGSLNVTARFSILGSREGEEKGFPYTRVIPLSQKEGGKFPFVHYTYIRVSKYKNPKEEKPNICVGIDRQRDVVGLSLF